MPKSYTEQVFRTTYKDDHKDSDGYHRILFNSGRALQARELTQMQTIIQKEISRFGSNVFKEGALVNGGGLHNEREFYFIKISGANTIFDTAEGRSSLIGVKFTGQTSNIVVRIIDVVAAEGSDPDTIYVNYLETPVGGSTKKLVTPGETLQGTVAGVGTVSLVVQTTNTTANPAIGRGQSFLTHEASFFVQGHFVFAPQQRIIINKYGNRTSDEIGFKVVQDIVTVADTDALYDNQGVTPNRSSPGADRYRIKLELTKKSDLAENDIFVYLCVLQNGEIVERNSPSENYNQINTFVSKRIEEINGDFIKRYFKAEFVPNSATTLQLKIGPGTAYIRGNRVDKGRGSTIVVPKSQSTLDISGEQISLDYGSYYEFDSGQGMLNFDTCQKVYLKSDSGGNGVTIGTANVRAIHEGTGSLNNIYLFNIERTPNSAYSLRQVKSIADDSSGSTNHVRLVLNSANLSTLQEPNKDELIFDTPIRRPKSFEDVTLTVQGKKNFTASSATETVDIFTSNANKALVNEGDTIIADDFSFPAQGVTANIVDDHQMQFENLTPGRAYQVLYYVQLTNQSIRPKTLTEYTVTGTLDSDGDGKKYLNLGKSDIYSVSRIRKNDSDGDNLFNNFALDGGQKETHYGDGRLIYLGEGLDSVDQPVFARFKSFSGQSGAFYAVNTYDGKTEYKDIPVQPLNRGGQVSLRDVIDFRPATNGSGSFTNVVPLPAPTSAIVADASYYLPRADKLVLSKNGEMRYLQGTPSLTPKYPSTPIDCIDLYKFRLNANTLHTRDLKSEIIPRKGYTMDDISKLEKRIDKIEELTTLSLLELATNNLKVLDSSGADRSKSGFFVDNFSNQRFTDTKNFEHRSALDPRDKLIRPSFTENAIELFFDSQDADTLRTTVKGDTLMLDYSEVAYSAQPTASKTVNLRPLEPAKVRGSLELSPSSDYWKESDVIATPVIDGGTELDTNQALLWNNHEWNWNGVDINELEIGATSSNVTGVNTTVTRDTGEKRLIGSNVTVDVGDWVVDGVQTEVTLGETEETVISRNEYWTGWIGGENDWDPVRMDRVRETTTEQRTPQQTLTTTNLSQTTTTTTELEYSQTTEVTTSTTTTTTVNRVASESTLRELVGSRVIDVALIPWMRSRRIFFKAEGLRPNTQFFPFFDGTNVSNFCREETEFKRVALRNAETDDTTVEGIVKPTIGHSNGATTLVSSSNGTLIGSFEIPNNSAIRFATGTREFALYDISVYDISEVLSFARAQYTASGTVDLIEETYKSTRILQIVGNTVSVTDVNVNYESTSSTETIVETSVAKDVETEVTNTEIIGDRTTTSEVIDSITSGATESSADGDNDGDDPIAQTVYCNKPNGMFITKVEVYFAAKDNTLPVTCEIRPVVNGAPSSSKVIAQKTVQSADVNVYPLTRNSQGQITSTLEGMLAQPTQFEFDEPVYVPGNQEFAFVLHPGFSMDYECYISEIEDFVLGSTEKRVTKQPTYGSFFASQNTFIWEPNQRQDIAYKIYRAQFENSGNAIMKNAIPPWRIAIKDGLYLDSGSSIVEVIARGHGLRVDDKVKLNLNETLWDSDTYGIRYSDLADTHVVTAADGVSFKIDVGTAATKGGRTGGGQITYTPNYIFERVRPQIQVSQPETTNVTLSGKFTTGKSLAGGEDDYVKDSKYTVIPNQKNLDFNYPRLICNKVNQTDFMTDQEHPVNVQISMTTTDDAVSPTVDLQRTGMVVIQNMIDKQDSASTDGFNVPNHYFAETTPNSGTHLAKHVTVPTTLAEDAVGLKILIAANRPPDADFDVYYKVADAGSNLSDVNWVLVSPEKQQPVDTNKNVFREYRYLVGGTGGFLDPFTKFQIKIVMKSTNSARVPVFRDLRAIALAV